MEIHVRKFWKPAKIILDIFILCNRNSKTTGELFIFFFFIITSFYSPKNNSCLFMTDVKIGGRESYRLEYYIFYAVTVDFCSYAMSKISSLLIQDSFFCQILCMLIKSRVIIPFYYCFKYFWVLDFK